MEKFVYVTNTSSTASGPPSPAGEGSRKSRFLAIDGCAARTHIFLGSSWTSTPTGEIEIFVSAIDGCAFCNHYDLGRPMVAPTDEI